MIKQLSAIATIAIIAGCNTIPVETTPIQSKAVFNKAKALAAAQLRDPEATRFKNEHTAFKISNGDTIVCGTLNGKNAMGGYVGYKPFYIRMRGNYVAAFKLPSARDDYGYEAQIIRQKCGEAARGNITVSS